MVLQLFWPLCSQSLQSPCSCLLLLAFLCFISVLQLKHAAYLPGVVWKPLEDEKGEDLFIASKKELRLIAPRISAGPSLTSFVKR